MLIRRSCRVCPGLIPVKHGAVVASADGTATASRLDQSSPSTSASTRLVVPEPNPRRLSSPASRRYRTSRARPAICRCLRWARSSAEANSSSASTDSRAASMSSRVDTLDPELALQRRSRQVPPALTGRHPVAGEHRIVDQAHVGQSIQHLPGHLLRHLLCLKCLVELVSGPGLDGQLAQRDGAGDGVGIGLGILPVGVDPWHPGLRLRPGHLGLPYGRDRDAPFSQPGGDDLLLVGAQGLELHLTRHGVDARRQVDLRADAHPLLDLLLQLVRQVGIVPQVGAGILPALAQLVRVVGKPGPGFANDSGIDPEVDKAALAADSEPIENVELRLLEWRRHFVFDHLDPGPVADHLLAVLQCFDAAHIQPDRGVELERPATGGRLRRSEHHPDLLPELVDEDRGGVRPAQRAGHLAQRLAHQAGLQADVAVPHLALDLGPGGQGGDRVDHDECDRAGPDQHVGDLQRLLAVVGLADQQVVGVHPQPGGIVRVEGVLSVDEGTDASGRLGVGDGVQGHRRLATGLRAVDLDHAAARQATDTEGEIQGNRPGGNDFERDPHLITETHHRTLAVLLVDLGQRCFQRLFTVCRGHGLSLPSPCRAVACVCSEHKDGY